MAGSGTAHLRTSSLLRVEDLVVEFPVAGRGKVQAVSNLSIDVVEQETVGLVGESGCGKSTTGRAILQLIRPNSGSVTFEGVDLTSLSGERLRRTRRDLQMVFQDPISSLNPRRRIGDIVAEPLRVWGHDDAEGDINETVAELFRAVGLDPSTASRVRPYQLSGGQCQRVSIARSLSLRPKMLICDEPVSALDVSVQAQIINLLEDMKRRYGLTMIFISHDLSVVKNVSDRVAVMYMGKLCEVASPNDLFAKPRHHYTAALLSAIPVPDPTKPEHHTRGVEGELPSTLHPPSGCRFRTRCPAADDHCAAEEPVMREIATGHYVACHHPTAGLDAA